MVVRRKIGLIYRHVLIYRVVLNLLYLGRYRQRFDRVLARLDRRRDKRLVELCFGDIYIAQWCVKHRIEYLGIDVNPSFVNWARARGHNVLRADLRERPPLGASDVVVIAGSLYHFHDILDEFIHWAMASTRRLIIAEPIRNWASRNDVWGRIAGRLANAGAGPENFRYDANSLRGELARVSEGRYSVDCSVYGKDAIAELRHLADRAATTAVETGGE